MEPRSPVSNREPHGATSSPERVARILRAGVRDGYYRPGDQLSEEQITTVLGIPRHTLREAFRLLIRERLLVYRLGRGVSVRVPTLADLRDLYLVRRHLECSAVRLAAPTPEGLGTVDAALEQGRLALARHDWQGLGTADIRFHQALVELAGSDRLDQLMRALLAELRLVFSAMANPRWFHEPYLARNRRIADTLRQGDREGAARLLHDYLTDAERDLGRAYADQAG